MVKPSPDDPADGGLPAGLPELVRALPPRCGRVRLVGIDGHAGSGKSTLAGRLSAALADAPVLHLDDLASHDAPFGWTGRLARQVLTPLAHGRTARYEVYDWQRREFSRRADLAPAPVVLLEGVGAGRRTVRPWLSLLIWLRVPPEVAWERGRRRDGPGLEAFWRRWEAAERRHFADDPSRSFADILITPRGDSYDARAPGPGAPGASGMGARLWES